jgi:hypothetical protein
MTSSVSNCTGAFTGLQYYVVNENDLVNALAFPLFIESANNQFKSENDTKNSEIWASNIRAC